MCFWQKQNMFAKQNLRIWFNLVIWLINRRNIFDNGYILFSEQDWVCGAVMLQIYNHKAWLFSLYLIVTVLFYKDKTPQSIVTKC